MHRNGIIGIDDRLSFRKRTAADILDVGLTKLDMLISVGAIKAVKSGKIVLIPRAELTWYLESLPLAVIRDHSNHHNSPQNKARREAERAGETVKLDGRE
jgi:excisionase family DNA binding protein